MLANDMDNRVSRRSLLAAGLAALLAAQVLYGILALSALYKTYRESLLSVQALSCEKMGQDLSRLARFGKEPDRLEHLGERVAAFCRTTGTGRLLVQNAEGKAVAAWNVPGDGPHVPARRKGVRHQVEEFSQDGIIWLYHPIRDRLDKEVGGVLLGVDEAQLSSGLRRAATPHLFAFLGWTAAACGLLALLVMLNGKPPFPRLGRAWCLVIPLLVSQLAFLFLLRGPFVTFQETVIERTATQLARHVRQDMEHVAALGLRLEQVPSIRPYLEGLQKGLPWVRGLSIRTGDGPLFEVGEAGTGPGMALPIRDARGKDVASVVVALPQNAATTGFSTLFYDTLTITVIAMLFMLELLALSGPGEAASSAPARSGRLMRPVIFLCMFAIDLPASFIPLRMSEINPELFGLPRDVVMGLPLSFGMLAVGLAILLGGFWSQKRGWRPLFLWGAGLVAAGNAASGLATEPLAYILARGGAGFGYGLINLAGQVFIVAHSTRENRAQNLAFMVAGLYAGFLCGSAFGGLIADRLDYASAFLVSAGLMACIGLGLRLVLPREPWKPESGGAARLPLRELARFLGDRSMLGLLLCNIFPCAFVTVCLFQFFIPVSLNAEGVSPAGIGRVFMAFCLLIIVFGPMLGRAVDRSGRKLLWLAGAGFLGVGGILALLAFDGLAAAFLSVGLLALCNAVASSAQGAYALELPATGRFGASRSMGVYNVTERLGQMLGPVTLGQVIALWGAASGLVGMAVVFAVLTLLFLLSGLGARKGTTA